jgi:ABC-2 type transport system permease protein
MNKIWLVIKREYLTRVRNKTFLLSTILLPIVIVLFITGSVFFAAKSIDSKKKIAIDDRSGFLSKHLRPDTNRLQVFFNTGVDTNTYTQKGFDGFMFPVDSAGRHFLLRTPKAASRETMERLHNSLNNAYVSNSLLEKNISVRELD